MNTLTESGARIMVQVLCRNFVHQTPWDETPNAWVVRARELQKGMARITGSSPTAEDIQELITTYEELESVDAGTHPDLRINNALTINNAPDLVDQLIQRVERETTELLVNAGYRKQAAA